jgi:hypothetical protein
VVTLAEYPCRLHLPNDLRGRTIEPVWLVAGLEPDDGAGPWPTVVWRWSAVSGGAYQYAVSAAAPVELSAGVWRLPIEDAPPGHELAGVTVTIARGGTGGCCGDPMRSFRPPGVTRVHRTRHR